jgi:hypothetical protein
MYSFKKMGLEEAAHTEPVCRSEKDTHGLPVKGVGTTSWVLNHFKTPSPLPNRLHGVQCPKKPERNAGTGYGCQDVSLQNVC